MQQNVFSDVENEIFVLTPFSLLANGEEKGSRMNDAVHHFHCFLLSVCFSLLLLRSDRRREAKNRNQIERSMKVSFVRLGMIVRNVSFWFFYWNSNLRQDKRDNVASGWTFFLV